MSCLAKLPECVDWLASYERETPPRTALRNVERAAREQRANYEQCVRDRRFPSDWSAAEYEKCVLLLEGAIPRLRERVAEVEAREAREQAEANRLADEERARILKKYPVPRF